MTENNLISLLLVAAIVTNCSDTKEEGFKGLDGQDEWIREIKNEQIANRHKISAYTEFQFEDRRLESGIDFKHQTMTDLLKQGGRIFYYRHENGLAIADYDNDGWIDIYFVSHIGSSQLWRNVGSGNFQNVTESAGVGTDGQIAASAGFADYDNDGDPDLFVTTTRIGNILFENLGDGTFHDVTKKVGLDSRFHSSAPVFFDYDGDGWLDLYVLNTGKFTGREKNEDHGYFVPVVGAPMLHMREGTSESNKLYRNVKGDFVDVTEKVGLSDQMWSGDATIMDVNDDGWMDLYVLDMHRSDEVFINQQGISFQRMTQTYFPRNPHGSQGVNSFDYNNDGFFDLFVTDMHADMIWTNPRRPNAGVRFEPSQRHLKSDIAVSGAPREKLKTHFLKKLEDKQVIWGNAFFEGARGSDGMVYRENSDELGLENYWPWGVSVEDVNADGFEDVFITASMNYPWRYRPNSMRLYEGGRKFVEAAGLLGIDPREDEKTKVPIFIRDCATEYIKLDCNGKHEGMVEVFGSLGSRSSVIFDLDNDGDLDIVTNENYYYPQVLVSDLSEQKRINYLKLRFRGVANNRSGIGTKVVVALPDGQKLHRVYDGKSGFISHSDYPLYIGLGENREFSSIEVTWANGRKQTVPGSSVINRVLRIEEN
ncbi:MAG: hypothetical protein F7O42_12170 [Opitutae bacterium]|nr:hypothetical protein [Opitutae bacterium]